MHYNLNPSKKYNKFSFFEIVDMPVVRKGLLESFGSFCTEMCMAYIFFSIRVVILELFYTKW